MQKFRLLLISCTISISVCAQLTQNNHAPAPGDSYQMYQCDSTNIQPGPSGSSVIWNFAVTTHSSIIHTYSVSASSNTMYPNATASLSAPGGNTSFFDSDATKLRYHGGRIVIPGQIDATLQFTTAAIYASYPAVLNTATTSVFGGNIDITLPLQTSGTFTGTNNFLADGTGTLILPGNIYNNVLRVASTQTIDSNTGFGNGTMYEERYDYFESGIKAPVFSIVSNTLITPLGNIDQIMVTRLIPPTSTVGFKNFSDQTSVTIGPNPANDRLFLTNLSENKLNVLLHSADGRLVKNILLGERAEITISELPEGIYYFQFFLNGSLVKSGKQILSGN